MPLELVEHLLDKADGPAQPQPVPHRSRGFLPVRACEVAVGERAFEGVRGGVALADRGRQETGAVTSARSSSVFAGFRFPREVISVAVRWYLRYNLSYRDAEELLAERGITVDHVTIYRWVQRFTPEFIEAARFCRHAPGDRWFAGETYVKVADGLTCTGLSTSTARSSTCCSPPGVTWRPPRFFNPALRAGTIPAEVTTDRAPAYPRVLDELIPSALHTVERYANNPVEADHGRLTGRCAA
jgi:IS6 family transposase